MYQAPKLCFDRVLPTDLLQPAMSVDPRLRAIVLTRKLWPNGTNLRVRFLGGSLMQRDLAMQQATWWAQHANLSFTHSDDSDAEIRVTFDSSDGAWSFIGTDCLSIPTSQATMNLGFQDGGTSAHEFGHAIGLAHEHQNPAGGIEWNEPEVIRDLSGPPNLWTVDQIRHNVLNKYSADQIRGTEFDRDSIMLYAFPARWTLNNIGTHANNTLSALDTSFMARVYPKTDVQTGPVALTVGGSPVSASIGRSGEEDQFSFVVDTPGQHIITTGGETDLVMKLYGPDSDTRLIAEDDDSGEGLNPRISQWLSAGRYLIQVRHYNSNGGTGNYTIVIKR